jgi:acetamidase/formamidase
MPTVRRNLAGACCIAHLSFGKAPRGTIGTARSSGHTAGAAGRSPSMFNASHACHRVIMVVTISAALGLSFALARAQQGQPSASPAAPPAIVPPVPASTPDQEKLRQVQAKRYPGTVHVLPATMETTQWGWFNNAQPPVLHVNSGDTVIFETMMHSHNQVVPGVTIEQIKKLRTDFPGRGPHTLTGPVHVEGAEPGDVLKIRINKIVPRAYATNFNVPGMFGQFPDKFPDGQVKYFYLDLDRKVAEFAPGIEIPLAPFPGTLGVARAEPGQYSSVPPGPYGGNLDIRDLTEGATLYVPVFVKGALLWTGDSHAAQGNGEVNLTALETAYREMSVTLEVIKTMKLDWPRIETEDSWITVGIDRDLNKALDLLKAQTAKLLVEQSKASAEQADRQMMDAWDCRISQVVDVNKGLHCFTAKAGQRRTIEPLPDAENQAYLVTVGKNADLNKAMDSASWDMINLLENDKKLSRLDAYSLASMVMDCRLAAPAGDQKAVHCLVPKSTWVAAR